MDPSIVSFTKVIHNTDFTFLRLRCQSKLRLPSEPILLQKMPEEDPTAQPAPTLGLIEDPAHFGLTLNLSLLDT